MLAAESVCETLKNGKTETTGYEPTIYEDKIKNSPIWKELKAVRNIRPSFHNRFGLYGGVAYSGFSILTGGREPWTFSHGGRFFYQYSVEKPTEANIKNILLQKKWNFYGCFKYCRFFFTNHSFVENQI